MSIILAGIVFAGTSGALYLGRLIARRRGVAVAEEKDAGNAEDEHEVSGRKEAEAEAPSGDGSEPRVDGTSSAADRKGGKKRRGRDDARPEPAAPKRQRQVEGEKPKLDGFVCQLGDVVMRHTGEEAWLAGGLVLSEEIAVAVLFVAPDAGHDCAIYVRGRPRDSLFWLEPLDPTAILVGGEPPSSVEHGGIRFDRTRRLPLRPRRIGVGAPDVGDAVTIAEYASAGSERLLVIKANSGLLLAYRGVELESGSFEVIASGASTLDL